MPEEPRISSAPVRQERRLVTALFADISGFSELTDRLDAEQLLEIIDPAIAALSTVVGRYGGVIEKFAGDALMALFGAPVAHDDDAARALHVALDMHAELARLVPRLPAEAAGLGLHIGVNSGHGIGRVIGSEARFDYGVLGDVVVLAQRLEAAAPTGETYVGETTHELAHKDFDFEAVGEVYVKGKEHPVRAWRLLGPRTTQRVPVLAGDGTRSLAGRTSELRLLESMEARVSGGGAAAVFVLGEPGVGKTALCAAVGERAAAAGWDCLTARCLSYGSALAYWPIADLMRRLFQLGPADSAASMLHTALADEGLEETAPFIAALLGVDGAGATDLSPQTFQTRLHEAVVAVLVSRAAMRPVLLHLDDLQWADTSTIAVLRDLLRAAPRTRLLLLASSRLPGAPIADELAAMLPGAALRLDLAPLDAGAVEAIATSILGASVDATLVDALVDHTRGNPFFVEEVTRSLAQRGAIVRREGAWQVSGRWDDAHVPVTVEGVVAARVDALGDAERDALEVLSVVGGNADLVLARAILPEVDAALPELRAAGLIDPAGEDRRRAVFHHPLTLQVVQSRLLRRRRAELHRAVGEAAERLFGADDATVDLLARHFVLGEEPVKAFGYALRAAERAERLFANAQAATYLRQALDSEQRATGSQSRRGELLLRCARVDETRGEYGDALSLYDEALALTGDVSAAAGRAATLRKLGDYAAVLETIRVARSTHADLTPEEAARLALEEGWTTALLGDSRRAVAMLRGGLTMLGGRDPRLEADLLIQLARAEMAIDAVDIALEHGEMARRRAEELEDLPRLATALRVLGGIQQERADADDAALHRSRLTLERALAVARRVGNAEEEAAALVNLAHALATLGLIDEAIQGDRDAAAAFDRVGIRAGVACALCNLAEHLADEGRWTESLEAAERALHVARETGNVFWITGALNGLAHARLELGDPHGAAAAADEAAGIAIAYTQTERATWALGWAADAREALGDHAAAETLRQRARELEARGSRPSA